jgi:hypothetical protein
MYIIIVYLLLIVQLFNLSFCDDYIYVNTTVVGYTYKNLECNYCCETKKNL